MLTPKFGSGWEFPEVKIRRGKPKYSTKSANRITHEMASSPQEDGPNRQRLEKENTSNFTEGKG